MAAAARSLRALPSSSSSERILDSASSCNAAIPGSAIIAALAYYVTYESCGSGYMIDFWRSAIRQQFHAAIDMLANAIKACPDSVWYGQGHSAFWYLAFHVLFFLDLYLSSKGESEFRPPPPFGLSELEDEAVVPE